MAGSTAKLTLQLVDGVTGPARGIAGALRGVNAAMAGISSVALAPARALGGLTEGVRRAGAQTAALSGALSIGIGAGARQNFEMEKQLNISVAAGNLSLAERSALMAEAVKLNADYAATNAEIVAGANELLKSGLGFEQTIGALPGILDSAQAMDVPIADASTAIVNSMVSMRMAMEDTQSTMLSSLKVADLFAHGVAETTASLDDFATSSKYFNPVAASIGMTPDEAMAYQVALAKAGIKGSSAGTGLRAAPVRIAAPSEKALAAFARLDMNPQQFLGDRIGNLTGESLAGMLEAAGFNSEGMEAGLNALLDDPALKAAPARLANAIMDQFADELGVATSQDRMAISTSLQNAILAGAKEVDLFGVLKSLKDAGAGVADYAAIFGLNHASKMQAIDVGYLENLLATISTESTGRAKQMRTDMVAGIVGDVLELGAAIERTFIAIGASGVLADAAKGIDKMATSLHGLAETNPALLRFGAYAALAVAAAAPLGFALSGLAAVAGLALNPITLVAAGLGSLAIMNFRPIANGLRTMSNHLRAAVDPAIIDRLRSTASAVREWASGLRLGNLSLNRIGAELGTGLAAGVNAAWAALPRLREIADGLPSLAAGAERMREAFDELAGSKLDALAGLTTSIAEFGQRALPYFTPAAAQGVQLVGASFHTLASGAAAVGRLLGGATEAFVGFSSGLYSAISGEALASAGNGIAVALEAISGPVRSLGELFDQIDLDIGAFAQSAGAKVGAGISAIVTAFANAPAAIGAAFEGVKATFAEIATFTPTFGNIISAVMAFAENIARGAQRVADAVRAIVEAVKSLPGGAGGAVLGGPGISNTAPALTGGAAIGAIGGANLPRKAGGGAIRRGMYLVGEQGPEVISMGGNGTVTPNHKLGGGDVMVNATFNITGSDSQKIADDVLKIMSRQIHRAQQTTINR